MEHSIGVELVRAMAVLLRDAAGEVPHLVHPPVGPGFEYGNCPELFLGRRGDGPLDVAWDTNLLVDYFEHGRSLWVRETWPAMDGGYEDQLEALQLIIALWVLRDLRFHLSPLTIDDARRRLSERRREDRRRAVERFVHALRLVGGVDERGRSRDGLLVLPERLLDAALSRIEGRFDRALIEHSLRAGHHVFLTRDKPLIAAGRALSAFGLRVCSPGDLLIDLVGCGAFHCMFEPRRYAYWPMPDLDRVELLLDALPASSRL